MIESISIIACGDERHTISEICSESGTEIVMSSFDVPEDD